jgi:hypothetical protein
MSTENTVPNTSPLPTQAAANPVAAKPVSRTVKKAVRKAATKLPAKAPRKAPLKPKSAVAKKSETKTASVSSVKPKPKAKPVAEVKVKKPKLVRDSFTFPKDEYQAIAGLKQKALGLKHSAKKSEILRAGLKLLNSLNDKAFLAALSNVPALKTGRPAKN